MSAAPSRTAGDDVRRLLSFDELRAWRDSLAPGESVGLIPTMGALHRGHEALVRRAAAECRHVVASIFVNPLQFDEADDFERYPRTLDQDCRILAGAGAHAAYVPTRKDMYPEQAPPILEPGEGGRGFEGAFRPGHFAGVLTVVHRLFERVRPTHAYFGEKDAQQLFLVGRMARELDMGLEVVPCETVREDDGLALSSRNRHLSSEHRSQALALIHSLRAARAAFAGGQRDPRRIEAAMQASYAADGVEPEYAAVVDDRRFVAAQSDGVGRDELPWRAVTAARVGDTRLIDNLFLGHA